jgi:putative Mg2+ transporter-C (MgtC) family protein
MQHFSADVFWHYVSVLFFSSLAGGVIGVFVGRAQNLGPGINKLQTIGTFGVVALAATAYAMIGMAIGPGQTQVIAGAATGVGFISGAVIFKTGAEVHGLTTAALIWACSSIGLAFGYEMHELALAATFYVIVFIWFHEHKYPDLRLLDALFKSKADKDL